MVDHTHPKAGLYISVRIKLMIVITLFFAIGFAVAFYWFYNFATDRALGRIEEDLRGTLDGAIEGVDKGDFEVLAEFSAREITEGGAGVPSGDPFYENPIYVDHQHWIEQIVRVEPRAIPYRVSLTALDVMIEVGGLTEFAAGNKTTLVRQEGTEQRQYRVRLDDLIKDGDISANVAMQPGDVLIIPESFF